MSRIDDALRMWEGAAGVDLADVARAPLGAATPLNAYAPEARSERDVPPDHLPPVARSPRIETRSKADRAARTVDPHLAARLVSGAVGPVSIEQYRRLAAALHDAQEENGLKTIMLTSALPHEGKTLTSVNLALTLSHSFDRRVLLIDADLRWPSVHNVLGIANDRGLTEALENADLPIAHVSDRLSVLPAGRPGSTPLAGLASPRMGALLEDCARQFDWVLVDTPPVGLLPDAQLLARLAGAVLLVIGAGSTPAATVERAVAELGAERIIGVVMNRVEAHRMAEAGYYDRYQSYGGQAK